MCGIAGVATFDGRAVSTSVLDAMARGVRHRGPDGERRWSSGPACPGVHLLHARLAVIDLSDSAYQPMRNDGCAGTAHAQPLTIVFNGEIYNFQDLRRDLEARGHVFTTHSDTEALLHLYEDVGPACVQALQGMFAFAIWDEAGQRMFCARDRVGKKPFYYRHDGSTFWFASEARAILSDPTVPHGIDERAIHAFLALGYVAGSQSAHASLKRLPPGHLLIADAAGVRIEPYWALTYQPKHTIAEADAERELESRLRTAVRRRLISDVPLGAFLSGGIDSSLVVALMSEESGSRARTFSIGFDDPKYNELPLANAVAQRFQTEHHALVLEPPTPDGLSRLAWHYSEPFADSSAYPTYELARLTRAHITVALNGDGGDESFAGYTRYWANDMAMRYQALPAALRRPLERVATATLHASQGRSRAYDLERFFAAASLPTAERYARWFGFFDDAALNAAFGERVGSHDAVGCLRDAFERAADLHPIDAALSVDVATYLPGDLLVKVDVATMAHGLEARSPLLDHDLMEFAARLPVDFKRRGRRGKRILRRIAARLLPEEIIRAPKRGFGIPVDRWLRHELKPLVRDLLTPRTAEVKQYVRATLVESIMDEHMSGQRSHGHRLWALLMLELWHRECLARRS